MGGGEGAEALQPQLKYNASDVARWPPLSSPISVGSLIRSVDRLSYLVGGKGCGSSGRRVHQGLPPTLQ